MEFFVVEFFPNRLLIPSSLPSWRFISGCANFLKMANEVLSSSLWWRTASFCKVPRCRNDLKVVLKKRSLLKFMECTSSFSKWIANRWTRSKNERCLILAKAFGLHSVIALRKASSKVLSMDAVSCLAFSSTISSPVQFNNAIRIFSWLLVCLSKMTHSLCSTALRKASSKPSRVLDCSPRMACSAVPFTSDRFGKRIGTQSWMPNLSVVQAPFFAFLHSGPKFFCARTLLCVRVQGAQTLPKFMDPTRFMSQVIISGLGKYRRMQYGFLRTRRREAGRSRMMNRHAKRTSPSFWKVWATSKMLLWKIATDWNEIFKLIK